MIRRAIIAASIFGLSSCINAPPEIEPVYAQTEQIMRRGVVAFHDSDHLSATHLFSTALARYQGIDDRSGVLRARLNLAQVALAMGNEPGVAHQLSAISAMTSVDRQSAYANEIRLLQASFSIRRRQLDAAQAWLEPLLEDSVDVPIESEVKLAALANRALLELLRASEGAPAWVAQLRAALEATPAPDPVLRGRLLRLEADIAAQSGSRVEARSLLERAYEAYREALYRPGIAATLEQRAALDRDDGDLAGAADRFQRALRIRILMLDRGRALALAADLEKLYLQLGDDVNARRTAALMQTVRDSREMTIP